MQEPLVQPLSFALSRPLVDWPVRSQGEDLYVNSLAELDALLIANGVAEADVVSTWDAIWPVLGYATALEADTAIYTTGILKSLIVAAIPAGSEIAFVEAAGTIVSSQSPTLNYPAVSENDIMVAFLVTSSVHNTSGTPPTGWTKILQQDGDFDGLSMFWKRAGASEPASEVWTTIYDAFENTLAIVSAYSGCLLSGDVIDISASGITASQTAADQGATTTTDNAMAITIVCANPTGSEPTFTWDSGPTERIGNGTTPTGVNGSNQAVYIADELLGAAGAYSHGGDASEANTWITATIALKPAT